MSPHSGQNLGGLLGSGATQPHLSHLIMVGAAAVLGLPQLAQNLPVLVVPQLHTQPAGACSAGLGLPQLAQNLPVLVVPQVQVQPPAGLGSGLGLPQLAQNLPWLVVPQAQVQPPAAGAAAPMPPC